MSRQNVDHYMRFRDQMRIASEGQKNLQRRYLAMPEHLRS